MIEKQFRDRFFNIITEDDVRDIINNLNDDEVVRTALEKRVVGMNMSVDIDLTTGKILYSNCTSGSFPMYNYFIQIYQLDQNFDIDEPDFLIPHQLLSVFVSLRDKGYCDDAIDFLEKMKKAQSGEHIPKFNWATLSKWDWVETDPVEIWTDTLVYGSGVNFAERAELDIERVYHPFVMIVE